MNRKDFLKKGCRACLLGTSVFALPQLIGCSPTTYNVFKTEEIDKKVTVPLQLFEQNGLQFVRPKGWQYDIAVQKTADGNYKALLMQCTHMDNQLVPSQNNYTCTLHGSVFNADGIAIKGPAENSLKKFKTIIENANLIILI